MTACTMPLSTLMSFFLKDTPFTAPPETVMELPAIVVSVFPSMSASVSAPWTARRKRRRGRVARLLPPLPLRLLPLRLLP